MRLCSELALEQVVAREDFPPTLLGPGGQLLELLAKRRMRVVAVVDGRYEELELGAPVD